MKLQSPLALSQAASQEMLGAHECAFESRMLSVCLCVCVRAGESDTRRPRNATVIRQRKEMKKWKKWKERSGSTRLTGLQEVKWKPEQHARHLDDFSHCFSICLVALSLDGQPELFIISSPWLGLCYLSEIILCLFLLSNCVCFQIFDSQIRSFHIYSYSSVCPGVRICRWAPV